MSMLKVDQSTPLYEQLKNIIKNDIMDGAYVPGEQMPSEAALQAHYGVSRVTVRRAVQELSAEGLLERRQGKGTFVTRRRVQHSMDAIIGFTDRMEILGHEPRRIIHSKRIIPAPDFVVRDLCLSTGEDVVEIKRTLCDGDSPLLFDECYYPAAHFPGLIDLIGPDVSTYRLIKEHFGTPIMRAHKRFNISRADETVAGYLRCPPGEPLFSIYKITYDRLDAPIQISISLVRGDHITYVLDADERSRHTDMRMEVDDAGRSVPEAAD